MKHISLADRQPYCYNLGRNGNYYRQKGVTEIEQIWALSFEMEITGPSWALSPDLGMLPLSLHRLTSTRRPLLPPRQNRRVSKGEPKCSACW